MDLKFPDSIWWPKLTVTWFCIMDESSVSPGDVAKRRRTSVYFRQLVTTRPRADWSGRSPWDFWVYRKVSGGHFQWEHLFLFSPEFTVSPISVFPSVIVQILSPVSSPTSLVGMFVYIPVYICLLNNYSLFSQHEFSYWSWGSGLCFCLLSFHWFLSLGFESWLCIQITSQN